MVLNGRVIRGSLALMLLLLVSGCGGISASHSVSPSTFLLPGLVGESTAKPVLQVEANGSDLVLAQAH